MSSFQLNGVRMQHDHVDGLVQDRRNSSALAMVLRLSCIKPTMCVLSFKIFKSIHGKK